MDKIQNVKKIIEGRVFRRDRFHREVPPGTKELKSAISHSPDKHRVTCRKQHSASIQNLTCLQCALPPQAQPSSVLALWVSSPREPTNHANTNLPALCQALIFAVVAASHLHQRTYYLVKTVCPTNACFADYRLPTPSLSDGFTSLLAKDQCHIIKYAHPIH